MIAGHGPNIGHGYVKYVVITAQGAELPAVVFPSQIARSSHAVAGGLAQAASVDIGGTRYWTGDDALLAGSPTTILSQQRLSDPAFIPALLRGALDRFGYLDGAASGICVTGLPASWATDGELARRLGERLREATAYQVIKVIPEPLGLIYSLLLDNNGRIVGDASLQSGKVGIVDIGHLTVDIAVIRNLVPVPASLDTWQLGTSKPLAQVRSQLATMFDRELGMVEADKAVRDGALRVGGRLAALPMGWDRPLIENGEQLASRLVEAWGSGAGLDVVLIGGGGAEVPQLVEAIARRFPQAEVIVEPQLAIARGYARLARRLGGGQ